MTVIEKKHIPVLVVDFGSQTTQLILRRVRELGVYSEIISHTKFSSKLNKAHVKGIILSGGPLNVYQSKKVRFRKDIFKWKIPILGICFGHQIISKELGGRVKKAKSREFGLAKLKRIRECKLTDNFFDKNGLNNVWMSHSDEVIKLAKGFKVVAKTETSKFSVVENSIKKFYGIQFHPEVTHTKNGKVILKNFIFSICRINKNWSSKNQKLMLVKDIKKNVGKSKVICALSGGVDSSVVAKLVHNAIGKQLTCIFVNTGLLRKNEEKQVVKTFRKKFKINLIHVDAKNLFLNN